MYVNYKELLVFRGFCSLELLDKRLKNIILPFKDGRSNKTENLLGRAGVG